MAAACTRFDLAIGLHSGAPPAVRPSSEVTHDCVPGGLDAVRCSPLRGVRPARVQLAADRRPELLIGTQEPETQEHAALERNRSTARHRTAFASVLATKDRLTVLAVLDGSKPPAQVAAT